MPGLVVAVRHTFTLLYCFLGVIVVWLLYRQHHPASPAVPEWRGFYMPSGRGPDDRSVRRAAVRGLPAVPSMLSNRNVSNRALIAPAVCVFAGSPFKPECLEHDLFGIMALMLRMILSEKSANFSGIMPGEDAIAMSTSRTFRAGWSYRRRAGRWPVPLGAASPTADNIVGGAIFRPSGSTPTAGRGAPSVNLQALQDIATREQAANPRRPAPAPATTRSAEYVAEKLKEAGYVGSPRGIRVPLLRGSHRPPVLVADGVQEPAGRCSHSDQPPGSSDVTGRLRAR